MNAMKVIVACIIAVAAIAASPAFAHARLQSSDPKAETTLEQSPTRIKIEFSQEVELPFTKIVLTDGNNAGIPASKPELDHGNTKTVFATIPALKAGHYHVQWSTMTHDGHKVQGQFAFKVK
jgi:copper resistance protein C